MYVGWGVCVREGGPGSQHGDDDLVYWAVADRCAVLGGVECGGLSNEGTYREGRV